MGGIEAEFDELLEGMLEAVIEKRPAEPYKELMYLLYLQLPEETRKLDAEIRQFGEAFSSQSMLTSNENEQNNA